MANRLGTVGQQYFDSNGDPLNGGKLNFYEIGTSTPKDTYSDEALTSANANPVVLDAAGRQGDIWFSGQVKVVLTDADDVQIDVTDPVGDAAAGGSFTNWSATVTYAADDIVKGSNGRYYASIAGSNTGNNPTSTSGSWVEVRHVYAYDANYSYKLNQLVMGSDGYIYRSLADSNLGNTPTTTPASWTINEPENKSLMLSFFTGG